MTPLWDFPPASLPRRELACYLVSEAMAVRVVPETRWADGPLGPGSAQRFLDLDLEFNPAPLVSPQVDPSLWPVAALDLVCNNADRKLGHLLIENGSDRIWAIDNGSDLPCRSQTADRALGIGRPTGAGPDHCRD